MLVTRKSSFSGITHTLDLPVTSEELERYIRGETLLQEAFPNLSAAEREFIKSGVTDEEWKQIFGENE